jgi:hypothetical protein
LWGGPECSEGGLYLPGAVSDFISIFDETLDQAAVVTFASSSANDLPMTSKFKTGNPNVNSVINNITKKDRNGRDLWQGDTCSVAGLTNALNINNSVNAPNSVKVVVFFTDGMANMSQGTFGGNPLNFGGPGSGADFWATNAPETYAGQTTADCSVNCGGRVACGGNVSTFISTVDGKQNFCGTEIVKDALNRCILVANQMRAVSNYVYAVGLNTAAIGGPVLQDLQEVANDPASPTFDDTKPVGAAFLSNGNDLTEVFQQVAADIILRLVQ